ncbi:MAG TPA: DUF559 domain-containing protein, partial [Polyangiaceae bacterium]
SGLLLVRVMREGARAAPARRVRRCTSGGCHGACARMGMTRTNNKPSFPTRSDERRAVLAERARGMRGTQTSTEELHWAGIRGRRLGVVFRRQVPLLGRFIGDFLAPAQRLVIEVDGAHHAERGRADARRDAALKRAGYRVVRVEASDLLPGARCFEVRSRRLKSGSGDGPTEW